MLAPPGNESSARYYFSAIYDPVRDRMVVFGGVDGLGPHNDVWALSLAGDPAWSALRPAGNAPSARYGHTAIYDPAHDRMIVFGGYDAVTGSRSEVWALSLSGSPTWSELKPGGSAAARYGHSAIYDAARKRMVVFGGFDGFAPRNDARALSLAEKPSWSAITTPGPPPPGRYAHTAVYDSAGARMVISGGSDGVSSRQDVWALSLSGSPAWTALTPGSAPRTRHPRLYSISLAAGSGIPIGDFASESKFNAEAGFQFGGSVDRMISDWIALGVDGSYNKNTRKTEGEVVDPPDGTDILTKDQFTTTQFGVHAKLYLGTGDRPLKVWALLGGGGYRFKEEYVVTFSDGELSYDDEGKSKTGITLGGKIGMGADFKASRRLSVGIGTDVNFILLDRDTMIQKFDENLNSLQHVGVHAGVTYHLGSK